LDKLNKWNCLTYRGAPRTLGVSVWRIRYAITSGYLPAPSVVLKRRALFSPEQVEAMRGFFEVEDAVRRQTRIVQAGDKSLRAGNATPELG
jgi:hypothetical protein